MTFGTMQRTITTQHYQTLTRPACIMVLSSQSTTIFYRPGPVVLEKVADHNL